MNNDFRYLVYFWTENDINRYNQYYVNSPFDIDKEHTESIVQYGTCVTETDDITEAHKSCMILSETKSLVAIYDTKNNIWFN